MMPFANDICADLADILLLYKDDAIYQATPSLDFIQDTVTCFSRSSTPRRAQMNTLSVWPNWDTYPSITSTPRALVTPSTSSLSIANIQTVFSPSPLPVSQVPSLVFPEISPPSQKPGNSPFERQFAGDDFSRECDGVNTQISPVARRNPYFSFYSSPTFSTAGGTPSMISYGTPSQDPQGAPVRVSLIDRFISAAANESVIAETSTPPSTSLSQDCCSSPLSNLSDLTPLSSPDSSDPFGHGFDIRGSSPPTSPTVERHEDPRQSNIRHTPTCGRNPSPPSRDSDYQPAKGKTQRNRKRGPQSRDGDDIPTKRRKTRSTGALESIHTNTDPSLGTLNRRRLPADISYHPQFPHFYLRFPVCSYLRLDDGTFPLLSAGAKRVTGIYNKPRDALDLYTPRFVRGSGAAKVGVCPVCIESPSRGGKGEAVWLSMKFSAYKCYHLQYAHGISSVSARPFSPPVAFRTVERRNVAKNERTSIQEGKCHKCNKWILVESIKDIDIKVKELYWWKHAAACHQGSHIDGDDDFFLDDEIYRRAQQTPEGDP